MRRSAKPRQVGFWAWVFGLIIVGGGLVALFSLTATDRIARDLPLGIDPKEVRTYAALFNRRPVEVGNTLPEILRFGGSMGKDDCIDQQQGGRWYTRWFEAEGYGDSVEVRQLRDRAGYMLRFKKNAPLNGQRRMLLVPATVQDIRSEYLELIASELGVITPSIGYVRVIGCGKELGLYRREERIDQDFIERRGLRNASLLKVGLDPDRPDEQFAVVAGDSAERAFLRGSLERAYAEAQQGKTDALAELVDEEAATAWLLMAWIDGRDGRSEPVVLAHQWTTGRMIPLYRSPRGVKVDSSDAPLAFNPITPLLARPDFRARLVERAKDLAKDLPGLKERFEGARRSWLPVLSDDVSMPFALTVAEREEKRIVERISSSPDVDHWPREHVFGPGHATFLSGMPVPPKVIATRSHSDQLAMLVQRYKVKVFGDTVFFARGKYSIDEDLIFPSGTSVVLNEGARLFLAPKVNVRCTGDLHVRGTLRNPVFIRPQIEASPFGTIAVLGSGSRTCSISGLFISGGSGALIDGVRHDGMISVQGMANTELHNSVIEEHAAESGVAVFGGQVGIEGVRSGDARKAAIQLSFAQGTIRSCQFKPGPSQRGSGVHLEASRVAIASCSFDLPNGTGVKADAASQVLVCGCTFTECAKAIESSEGTLIHLADNTFANNRVALSGSGSTSVAGAHFILYTNTFTENTTDRALDVNSRVELKGVLEGSTLRAFGLPETEEAVVNTARRRRSGN